MAYVIHESCVGCKYGDCAGACPVSCFYEGPDMLYINPEECIDCDACREECPVEAIKSGDEADPAWAKKNAEFQFTEDKRRTSKDQVQHGPKWEESRARK